MFLDVWGQPRKEQTALWKLYMY